MFHSIVSDIGRSQGCDTTARPSRRAKAAPVVAAFAVIAGLALASVSAGDAAEDSSRMAREQHACAVVMGLHQPGDLYDTCIRSLSKSLSGLDQARLAKSQRSECAENGLTPGTRAFNVCVVTQNNN
jgi:hypothetical protein